MTSLLKQVLEVQILLVSHILQTVLAVNLCTGLVELVAHGKVLEGSGQSGCFTLVSLLLLDPSDVQDLKDDDYPEDDPNDQNTLESIDLIICQYFLYDTDDEETYVLRCKLRVENVRCDDVANGVSGVERGVVDGLLGLSSTIATHPRNEQRVDGVHESDQIVPSEQTALVVLGLGKCDHQSNSNNDDRHKTEQEWRLALEAVCEIGCAKDRNKLQCARWHVEKYGLVRGEAC